jgi:hypothetical protein
LFLHLLQFVRVPYPEALLDGFSSVEGKAVNV